MALTSLYEVAVTKPVALYLGGTHDQHAFGTRRVGQLASYTTADIESFVPSFDDQVSGDPASR